MAESNLQAFDINMVDALDEKEGLLDPTVEEQFQNSPWYSDILYVQTLTPLLNYQKLRPDS